MAIPHTIPTPSLADHPRATTPTGRLTLRPYQEEALRAIQDALTRGVRRQLVTMPMGSGKTVLAARLPELLGDARLIYLSHRRELLDQTKRMLERERPDRPCGVERADDHAGPSTPSVVATVQSLSRPGRFARYDPALWPLMVADEAHRATAPSYAEVFRYFRHLPRDAAAARSDGLLLGLTGTTKRTDQVGLNTVFQEIAYSRTLREMIEAGYLCPLRGYTQRSELDLSGVGSHRTDDGERDYDLHALSRAVNTPERNALVVEATRQYALADRRPTLVFCCDIAHTDAVAALFRRAGVRAQAVHSQIPDEGRDSALAGFLRGDLDVLVNCEILLEGVDLPHVAAITMARPTQSSILLTQALGRGLRLSPETGKTDCLVIDVVDTVTRHAAALVTLPTLFGLPPQFALRGERIDEAAQQMDAAAQALESGIDDSALARIRSLADIPRLFREIDFWRLTGIPADEAALTPLLWQRLPGGTRVLAIPKPQPAPATAPLALTPQEANAPTRIAIQPNTLDHYEIRLLFGPGQILKLAETTSLREAFEIASRHIETHYPDRMRILRRDEPWRYGPATDRQIGVLRRLRIPHPEALTAGQASQLISYAGLLRLDQRAAHAARMDEPATPGQIRYLRFLGIATPAGLTKRAAGRLIRDAKDRRRSPRAAHQ